MTSTATEEKIENQETALQLKEQGHTYKQVAADMGITEGAAKYLVQCANRRMEKSPVLVDRLRVHPDWLLDENYLEDETSAKEQPRRWVYLPNIPGEVVWCDANGSEITEEGEGWSVLLPYAEYEQHPMSRTFPLKPGNIPVMEERHYPNDQAVIDDLPVIQGWTYPESLKKK